MNFKPWVKKQRRTLPHQNLFLREKLMKRKAVYYYHLYIYYLLKNEHLDLISLFCFKY